MTWVIGASSIFGTGALISDTRVRFSDGTTAELLQKAYPVANYIAAGFAGSVRIGFELIRSLQTILAVPAGTGPHAWDLRVVAPEWQAIARQIFREAVDQEKLLGSQVLLVGPSPTENMGAPEFPRMEIVRATSPDFVPRFSSKPALAVRHIGSGGSVSDYKRAIRPLFRLSSRIHQAHIVGIHEWARTLAFSVTITVRDYPNHGISEHFHVVAVRLGDMVVYTNDMATYPKDGPPLVLKMPPVARSWSEFEEMVSAMRASASGATC
jgi:hypothetical protein